MKYLVFSRLNKNYLLFFSYFLIDIIREIINHYYSSTSDIVESFHKYHVYSLSDFLSIIPIKIIKKRSKSIKEKNSNALVNNKTNDIDYIYNSAKITNTNKRNKRIFTLLFVISIFEFLAQYSNVIFNIIQKKKEIVVKKTNLNSVLIVNIITKYLFSLLILHTPFYKYHYFSFAINIIFLIALGVIDILKILDENDNYIMAIFYTLMRILSVTFYSIEDVYAKALLFYDSISPYILLFYRGIFVCLIVLLFTIVFIFVDLPDENGENSCVFTRIWKIYINKLNILSIIGLFIFQFLYNTNIFFIVDKFSPSHMAMASVIGNFGFLLTSIIIFQNMDIIEFLIRFILYFILIISISIHTEIIILKCFGLESHTKLFMEKEAQRDFNNNETNNNLDSEELRNYSIEVTNIIKLKENLNEESDD